MRASPSRENCRPTELYGQAVTDDRGQPKPLEPACRRLVRCARRRKESPARPAPTVPCPNPAAQQSHCRSRPAGECPGVHAAGKVSPARPPPTLPCPHPAAQQSHCRSLPAGDCLGVHAAGKVSPARPTPTVPCPDPAAQQSHCRSLPAGDRLGVHTARKNRRQGQLLQCPAQTPRRNKATV